MHHVFVSYSRRDSSRVLATVEALRRSGVDVWIDQRDLEASVPWMDEITLAIEGAAVVVVFDSPAWRESAPCAAELATARGLGVRVLFFDAFAVAPAAVVSAVQQCVGSRAPAEFARTELLVRASIWNRQQRQRAQLVGGRTLQRYRAVTGSGTAGLPPHVHGFLGASRRRQRRKRTVRVVGSVLATIVLLVGVVSYFAFDVAGQKLAMTSARFDLAEIGRGADALNPYLHLQRLALYEMEWENAEWESSTNALLPVLPFRREDGDSEGGRVLFASAPEAIVNAPDGRLTARLGSGNEIDIVDADGNLYRTLRPAQRPAGLAWSPDGTWLAVGSARDVVLLDVTYGVATRLLTGGAGTVTDVRWTADGRTVIARTVTDLVLAWDVSVGTTRTAIPDDGRLVDLARMPDGEWAVLTRTGTVLLLDSTSLAVRDRFELGTGEPSGRLRISADGGRLAFLSLGDRSEVVTYDVATRHRERIPLTDCDATDFVFSDDAADSLSAACVTGGILSLDLVTGESATHATDDQYVAIARSGESVYAATYTGILQRLGDALAAPQDLGDSYLRPESVTGIVISDDGERLYHRGAGANTALGSNRMLDLAANPVESYALIFAGQPVGDTRAVAVSPDGELVAHGFDDGSVWIRKPLAGWAVQRIQPFTGPVRGVAFTADGNSLLVAGEDGQLVIVDMTVARDTEAQRRERLGEYVQRGTELALYRDALPPELQPGK